MAPASERSIMGSLDSLLVQLKRRHVYRVAVVYAAVGWLLVQIVTQVFPVFSFPAWTEQLAVLAIIGGFPIALVLAWAYELTPDGIQRDIVPGAVTVQGRSHRIDIAVGTLAIASLVLGAVIFSSHRATANKHVAAPIVKQKFEPAASTKSIAVMPFDNLSDDHANAYFAAGMQEQIRTQLTRLSGLKVVSNGASQKAQGPAYDRQTIARELGVSNLLEGSVQKSGGEARISLQLIDVGTNTTLWAETYDRNLSNIFSVESEVAAQVADALKVRLLPRERQQLAVAPTRNPQAYDALLKGVAAQQRADVSWQRVDIDAAIAAFQQATTDDSQFSLAYARLGYAYVWATNFLLGIEAAPILEHSREAFARALALDPDLPEAHVAAGFYHLWGEGDNHAARDQFKEALALNPNNAEAQLALGEVEQNLGHLDDADIAVRRAITLDPRSNLAWMELASLQQEKRHYADADQSLLKAVAINPAAGLTWGMRDVNTYLATGDGAAQYAMILAASPSAQANPTHRVDRAMAAYHMHDYAQAIALYKTSKGSVYPPYQLCGKQADAEWAMGDRPAAKTQYRRCIDLIVADDRHMKDAFQSALLGWCYARLGHAQDAEREGLRAVALIPIEEASDSGGGIQLRMAAIWAQLGRPDKAVPLLDQLLSTDRGSIVSIATVRADVEWDPIRNDPAFKQLLQRYAPR